MCKVTTTTSSYSAPTTPTARVTRKRVRFGNIREQEASERHSFCEEEMEDLWYSKPELKALRKLCKHLLKGKKKFTEDCYRGLEVFVNNNRVRRQQESVFPVLKMHWENRQLLELGDEEDILRSLSTSLNMECLRDGVARAAQDAAEAFEIYQECSQLNQKVVEGVFLSNTYSISASEPIMKASNGRALSA